MVEYKFKIDKEVNFWAASCQIERLLNVIPTGLSMENEWVTIYFEEKLDVDQLKSLTEIIAQEDFGEFPEKNIKFDIKNIWEIREEIKKKTGVEVLAVNYDSIDENGNKFITVYLDTTNAPYIENEEIKLEIISIITE